MTQDDFRAALWPFIARRLPLRYGRDTLYVSAEAAPFIPDDLRLGTQIDLNLKGVEMRLQMRTR